MFRTRQKKLLEITDMLISFLLTYPSPMVPVRHCPAPFSTGPLPEQVLAPRPPLFFIACVYSSSWFLFLPSFAWHFMACNIKDTLHPPSVWVFKSLVDKFFFSALKSSPKVFTWCHWPSGNTTLGQSTVFWNRSCTAGRHSSPTT